jgi:hypothetical protein
MKIFAGYFYPIPLSVWNKSASDDYYNVHGRSAGIKSFTIDAVAKRSHISKPKVRSL